MKTLEQKVEEHVNDFGKGSVAAMWVRAGANFAIPLAKAEGFKLAIEYACALDMQGLASELEAEGIRLGILPAEMMQRE